MRAGKHPSGFTLIELLVTIAVIAIIATIALPNFQSLITSNRQSAEYNKVLSGFHFARSEAVKRRENVSVSIDNTSGKWVLSVSDVNNDLIKMIDSKSGLVNVDNATISFNPLGRLQQCSLGAPCIVSVGALGIEVNAAGNIDKAD